jgi:hypothetical protein
MVFNLLDAPMKSVFLAVNAKYTFCIIKYWSTKKNLKTGRVPYLTLELTMLVIKSKILLVRQSFNSPSSLFRCAAL